MSDRGLSTPTRTVFGDVKKGTECRVCSRDVDDGRSKYCSDYCRNLAKAVMGMLNWSSVRRRIIERDDHTCQECGFDRKWIDRGREHIREIIFDDHLPDRPRAPSALKIGLDEITDRDWAEYDRANREWCERRDELQERYGDPSFIGGKRLEVDHITPVTDGGHPFDPGNLWTLCEDCHGEKTAREATERAEKRAEQRALSRPEIEAELADFVAADGGTVDAEQGGER